MKIHIEEKFAAFTEHWRPKIVAQANGQDIRLVKTKGTFPWHSHRDAEETFLCWKGSFRVEFRDRVVTLGPVFLAFLFGQRFLLRGIATSGGK